jgi:TP901 family phage tail tape measure protein
MSANEKASVQVTVNNEEAKLALEELQTELKKIKQLRKEAFEKGDTAAFEMYDKQFKKIGNEAARMKKEIQGVESVLRNLNQASPNELTAAFRSLQKQMNNTSRTDPRFAELKAQAKLLKNEINSLNNEFRQQQSFMSKIGDGFNKYFGIITAGAATFAGLILAGKKSVEVFNQFEEKVDNLSSLTRLEGEQLQWLSDKAKETSISLIETSEGNIRIKQSADAIVDAYTKVGSQRPELLKNKEAMHEVTQDAIILSEAAKTQLQPAVEGLTMAMNQLGLGADQSRRIINTMAAGSLEGAGDIPYLTEAYEKSGTSARLMGISVEQLTGVIEGVAPSFSEARVAGTSLDRVLLKMKENNIGYVDGQFNMIAAIEELEKRYKSGESAADIFGNEHAKMGEILVLNKNDIIKYTAAVTDTQVALEQASKNTSNNAAKLAQAQNRAQLYRIELGEKLAPVMTNFTSTGAMALKVLSAMVDLFSKHGVGILFVAGAVAAYTIALRAKNTESKISLFLTKSQAIAQTAYGTIVGLITGKIKFATIAQKLWNTVIAMNPIGALIAGIMLAVGAVILLVKAMNSQTVAQKAVKDVTDQAKRDIIEQKVKTEQLLAVAKDEKKSLEERKKALAELNKISPEYFGNLSIEKSTTEQLTAAGEAYIKNLEKQAIVKAAEDKIAALRAENGNKEVDIQMKKTKWWETEEGAAKRRTKAINDNKEAIVSLQEIVDNNTTKPGEVKLSDPTIGTRKNENGIIYEWDGKKWNRVDTPVSDDERKKARDKAFDGLELAQKKELNAIKQHQLEVNATEEEYNKLLADQELKALNEKLAMQVKYGEDTTDTTAVILDKKLKLQEDADKKSEDQRKKDQKKTFDDLDSQLKNELALIKKNALAEGLSEEETKARLIAQEIKYLNEKLKLQLLYKDDTAETTAAIAAKINEQAENAAKGDEARLKKLADLKEKYLNKEVTAKEQLNNDLADLEKLNQEGAIASYEEYQKLKTAINKKAEAERLNQVLEYGKAVQDIMGGVSDFFGAMKDKELAKAGDDEKKKEQIEAKYAKKQQGIAAFQAGINGAVAIMQLWASPSVLPEPAGSIYKGIMSGIIAGTTIAQISAITSKKFKSGSFTPTSPSDDTPVGVVHANEWVASAPLLRNPETRRHIDYLEAVQRNLSPRFNTAAISTASIGFKAGGFSPENTNTTAQPVTIVQHSDPALLAVMQQNAALLQHLKDNGVNTPPINANEVFAKKEKYDNAVSASEY